MRVARIPQEGRFSGKPLGVPIMDTQKLNKIKQKLLSLQEQILSEVNAMQKGALSQSLKEKSGDLSGYAIHLADSASDSYDRDLTLTLASREQNVLNDINAALEKIESGEYGCCEQCAHLIDEARLDAVPYARLCLQCKEHQEKNPS
jgi:DnaK suppressor protein